MININSLPPFKKMCVTVGNLPSSFVESMSYYEALCWMYNFLDKTVIPAINTEGEAITELQTAFTTLKNYVDNYFENLDVQEEINNKLDEMAESGELTDIIAQYLGLAGILTFDTVAAMKLGENLVNGSTVRTIGHTSVSDNGGAYYKVREIINTDVVDEMFLIALADENLVAELIHGDSINLKQIGIVSDGSEDVSDVITAALSKCDKLIFESGTYYINDTINIEKNNVTLLGTSYRNVHLSFGASGSINFVGTSILNSGTHRDFLTLENLHLKNYNTERRETPFLNLICCSYIKMINCWIYGKGKQILMWECFDSRILNTDFEWGGDNSDSYIGLELRSTNGGDSNNPSYEYTNNIYFYGCRFESHVGKCVASTGTNTNKIIFESCKFESFNCLQQNALRFISTNTLYFTDCIFGGSLANTKNYVYIDGCNDFKIDGFGEHSQGTYSGKKLFYLTGSGKRVVTLALSNNSAYNIDYVTFGIDSWDNNIFINGDIKVNNFSNKDLLITNRGAAIKTLNDGSTDLNYTILENGFLTVAAVGTYGQTTPQFITVKDNTTNVECTVMTIGSNYQTQVIPVQKGDNITCTKNTTATAYINIKYNRGNPLS